MLHHFSRTDPNRWPKIIDLSHYLKCICSKIMEHIVVSNIMHHFENHRTLSNPQHGFHRGHSCETQLIAFVEDRAKEMQNGGQTCYGEAFDKLPHQELRYKLSNYGINIATLSWLKIFL